MVQVIVPYWIRPGWFIRLPCYLKAEPCGMQVSLSTVDCIMGRPVGFVAVPGQVPGLLSYLDGVWRRRYEPGFTGIDGPSGPMSIVVFGLIAGPWHDGGVSVDVHVPGGGIRVEPG